MKKLLLGLFLLCGVGAIAQGTITGKVIDNGYNQPLAGADVLIKGTEIGSMTDFDGNFTLTTDLNQGVILISYVGYESKEIEFNFSDTQIINLGEIRLNPGNQLDEIVLVGRDVLDVALERETPVAVSTVRSSYIQEKIGNQEFPEILEQTPSVYVTKQGGGFGDSRMTVRGFNQVNTSVIINGQPVNDMENGIVYWSNWLGLADVAAGVQVQRGLGATNLAIPSVGGTVNIVTKSTEKQAGGRIQTLVGNDSYLKTLASYNTGLGKNGWATSLLISRWEGDGYIDGTKGEGYTYFGSVGYAPVDSDHAINITFTGAGQWHHQRTSMISLRDYFNFGGDDFRKFNIDWGYLNGEEYSFRRNFYNKPIATLNWDWDINDKLSLATALYGSWGRGGGTGPRGRNFGINPFGQDLTAFMQDGNTDFRTNEGIIDFDAVVANNKAGTPYQVQGSPYEGLILGSNGYNDNGVNSNIAIRRSSMNSHNWYGAISKLKYETGNWTIGAGVDLRYYEGFHYRVVNDLLGLDGYFSTGNQNLSEGLIITETIDAKPFKDTGLKYDKIDYYNVGIVKWSGFNGKFEYKKDNKYSAIIQYGISNQNYQREDYFDEPNNIISDDENKLGGYVKGGANYNIDDVHNVFFNAGYISRQPFFDAIFPNFANEVNQDAENETITSFEVGYGYTTSELKINLNLYNTLWSDRFFTTSFDFLNGQSGTAQFSNVEQLHQGVELEVFYKPITDLMVSGMLSVGDWRYKDNVESRVFDENNNFVPEASSTLYLEDVKVGNAAQTTLCSNGRL
ncbi:TonB-dependent receptor [Flavobacterium sp. CS20]|uniref:TonB-dependent receptor n=1 Tax=Flavobacterium sp. CS20 TaxID=2775246 RepID=UPI001FFCC848|nr:TonB-dependent receptor [Flavobacterium sp. CS20]